MASPGEQRSGLSDAAGRAALFPARAAARVWRDQLEAAVDEVLSAPEIARVIDRALAGSLPEEIARSVVRHRVLERVVDELAASGELERLLNAALASPRTLELTDRVLASEETQHALRQVASSPEIRDAIEKADGGACRGGRGWRPCVCRATRRPRRTCRQSPQASRPPSLCRHRDAGACACGRCDRDDCHVHGGGRGRRNRGVARRWPGAGVARRHPALGRLDPHRRHVLRALLEHRWTHARHASDAPARRDAWREAFLRSADRSSASSGSCCRSRSCSSVSSRCCSTSADAAWRTFSQEPSCSTTTRASPAAPSDQDRRLSVVPDPRRSSAT